MPFQGPIGLRQQVGRSLRLVTASAAFSEPCWQEVAPQRCVLPGKADAEASLWKHRGHLLGIPAGSLATPGRACSARTTAAPPSLWSSASSHSRDRSRNEKQGRHVLP